MNTGGILTISDTTGGGIASTSTPLVLNQWNRIEWHLVAHPSLGSMELKVFAGDSLVPYATTSYANRNTGAEHDRFDIGYASGGTTGEILRMYGLTYGDWKYPGPLTAKQFHAEQIVHRAGGGQLLKSAWALSEATDPPPLLVGGVVADIAPSTTAVGYPRIVDG
jgi:hypothetical protein